MSHITPTIGRIVWYRGADGEIRPAIVTKGNGDYNADLYVFPLNPLDTDWGNKATVTHADPGQEPGCLQSWHWMPYQKQQAEKQAGHLASADQPKIIGGAIARQVNASTDTSDTAIEREIVTKGKTAPRVTPMDIEVNIKHEVYFTAAEAVDVITASANPALELLTFCVITLQNGFTVTGESACASPENFDAEIGRKVARQNAVQKVWPLMGYQLKQQLHLADAA